MLGVDSRLLLVAATLAAVACAPGSEPAPSIDPHAGQRTDGPLAGSRSNIVVILTDDQRWDTLDAMPTLRELAEGGVRFDHVYVTTPACVPSRASLLAGGLYAAETGVLANSGPNGDFARFDDTRTLGTYLQAAGYRTGLIGKYLNNYPRASREMLIARGDAALGRDEAYIPPGWDSFRATTTREHQEDRPWHSYTLSSGSSTADAWTVGVATEEETYITDLHAAEAVEFIDDPDARPFFLLVSTHAPHAPAIPADQDREAFGDFLYRGRGYAEADVDDKPSWVPRSDEDWIGFQAERDAFHRDSMRTLLSVDRLVEGVLDAIERRDAADTTLVLYTSDNGMQWGEHRDFGKNKAYEESLRVPLVALGGGLAAGRVPRLIAANLDVGATILDVAGVGDGERLPSSGASLLPFLAGSSPDGWRDRLLIESYADPLWMATLRLRLDASGSPLEARKWVEYYSGDREQYDLLVDPFELESYHRDGRAARWRLEMHDDLPVERGPVITSRRNAPQGRVGESYAFGQRACCITGALDWTVDGGELPPGLVLDAATGEISGTPTEAGVFEFVVRVSAPELQPAPGRPTTFARDYRVRVQRARRARG